VIGAAIFPIVADGRIAHRNPAQHYPAHRIRRVDDDAGYTRKMVLMSIGAHVL
jgi:hypothetical protein